MNKHTPGPWYYAENTEFGSTRFYIAQAEGAEFTPHYSDVATVYAETCSGDEMPIQEANARLIAAAPELLEALESAIDSDGGTHYDGEDDEVGERSCCGEVSYKPHLHDCWVVKARAAIAKAKGQTP